MIIEKNKDGKVVSFYGAKKGMTPRQELAVFDEITRNFPIKEFRHCDTIGATEKVHDTLIRDWKDIAIKMFPFDNPDARAFCATLDNVIIEPEQSASDATKNMCEGSNVLIAAPGDDSEFGGTWVAIRIAKKLNVRKIIIIMPDAETRIWPNPDLMPRRKK